MRKLRFLEVLLPVRELKSNCKDRFESVTITCEGFMDSPVIPGDPLFSDIPPKWLYAEITLQSSGLEPGQE